MEEPGEGEEARSYNMWDARNVWDWDKEWQRVENGWDDDDR